MIPKSATAGEAADDGNRNYPATPSLKQSFGTRKSKGPPGKSERSKPGRCCFPAGGDSNHLSCLSIHHFLFSRRRNSYDLSSHRQDDPIKIQRPGQWFLFMTVAVSPICDLLTSNVSGGSQIPSATRLLTDQLR